MVSLNTGYSNMQNLAINKQTPKTQLAKAEAKAEVKTGSMRTPGRTQTTEIKDIEELNTGEDFKFPWRKLLKIALSFIPVVGGILSELVPEEEEMKTDSNKYLF